MMSPLDLEQLWFAGSIALELKKTVSVIGSRGALGEREAGEGTRIVETKRLYLLF
jgi:hypothetical protein